MITTYYAAAAAVVGGGTDLARKKMVSQPLAQQTTVTHCTVVAKDSRLPRPRSSISEQVAVFP